MLLLLCGIQKDNMFVAMRVPAAWLDLSVLAAGEQQAGGSSHLLLAKMPAPLPVHLPEAGLSLLPLAALGGGSASLLECWTALLCRLILYLPITSPTSLPPPGGNRDGAREEEVSDTLTAGCSCIFSVDQITALLLPTAPESHTLGGLHPHPPHHSNNKSLRNDADNPGHDPSRPTSRPSPLLIKGSSDAAATTQID